MNAIPEAAATVQAAADAVVAERVADIVEASQERIAEAEAAAQHITDAAIQTELGRRVEAIERGISECLQKVTATEATTQAQETRLAELVLSLEALRTQAPQPEVRILSTPEASEANPAPVPEVLIPEELPASEAGAGQGSPEPRKPRRRLL